MANFEQNQKRSWRLWKHRSLICVFFFCFFCVYGHGEKNKKIQNLQKKQNKKFSAKSLSLKKLSRKKRKNPGYKISYIKRDSLLYKLKLKKGDQILFADKKAIQTKKDFQKIFSKLKNRKTPISILLIRNKKTFLFSYKMKPSKGKHKIFLSQVLKLKSKQKVSFQNLGIQKNRKPSSIKNRSKNRHNQKLKTKLFPKKYKTQLQRAYVKSLNSFIYKHPDFDSKKLYTLALSQRVLISKKIFQPLHKFGSFYKIFLFKPKKIIGFISEAEVIPEFLKEKQSYIPNSSYKLVEKKIKTNPFVDLNSFEKNKQKAQIQNHAFKRKKKHYFALFMALEGNPWISLNPPQIPFGLQIGSYDFLFSSLTPEMNLNFIYNKEPLPNFHSIDMSLAYPFLKQKNWLTYFKAGVNFRSPQQAQQKPISIRFFLGPSLVIPTKKILFQISAQVGYGINNPEPYYTRLSSSLQFTF